VRVGVDLVDVNGGSSPVMRSSSSTSASPAVSIPIIVAQLRLPATPPSVASVCQQWMAFDKSLLLYIIAVTVILCTHSPTLDCLSFNLRACVDPFVGSRCILHIAGDLKSVEYALSICAAPSFFF